MKSLSSYVIESVSNQISERIKICLKKKKIREVFRLSTEGVYFLLDRLQL